jgi:outer membrane protein assembly factor BamB
MNRLAASAALLCVALALPAAPAAAGNWAQWRGPHFNGSSAETGLPATFSETENVTWAANLPGIGASTPIVWGDRVFLTAQVPHTRELWALCLDRRDGSVRWRKPFGTGFSNRQGNTGASPSAITDGRTVWFYFGTGDLAAFDLDGNERWRRNIATDHGPFDLLWDYGATGLLYEGRLYIPVIHGPMGRRGGQVPADAGERGFLLAVDPATGRDLFKQPRPTDAPHEARQAYTTPIPFEAGGTKAVLVKGGDYVTAHDPATGKEVWRSPDYNPREDPNFRTIVSPAVAGGMAIVCAPRGGQRIYGLPVGRPARGWAWAIDEHAPDVCTPLVWAGDVFVLVGNRKSMLRVEPATGKVLWRGDLGTKGIFQASPTGADGRIYTITMRGEAVVLDAGDRFRVLHTAEMGGNDCRASIAVSDGQLFVRTDARLFCIGKRKG